MELTIEQQERFQRNLLVEGFTPEHQTKLTNARIAVVGAGGLGSAVLNYLTAVGVGHITIVEFDTVALSNLQRQVLYTTPELGRPKVEIATQRLTALNPSCDIRPVPLRLTTDNAEELLAGHDLIMDCTDNYKTRYIIDDFCQRHQLPMVYGTAEGYKGQVSVFNTSKSKSYRSLYSDEPVQKPVVGVLCPIVAIVGSTQAFEAVKILTGLGETLEGRLLLIDGFTMQFRQFAI